MSSVMEKADFLNDKEELAKQLDYKMVTFSLGGRDYGIDIMKVKEIAKNSKYTIVPNTPSFVLGVHNLRGEIIPLIDLRRMLRLPAEKQDELVAEDVLILRLADSMMGVVVDSIDKVVSVSSQTIQPPHPIFSDINIKYIHGVVESNGDLYVILDVDRIFGAEEVMQPTASQRLTLEDSTLGTEVEQAEAVDVIEDVEGAEEIGDIEDISDVDEAPEPEPSQELDFQFISETLATFKNFYVSDLNRDWVIRRVAEWKELRAAEGTDIQLTGERDADEFLQTFYSPYTDLLWGEDYVNGLSELLLQEYGTATVWNPGCGNGYETFSIACLLKMKNPDAVIKVWGNDNDLLRISNAPNIVLPDIGLPQYMIDSEFVKESAEGYQFTKDIRDLIIFEYHDILHGNEYWNVDIILARDVVSFFEPESQGKLLDEFHEKLNSSGVLVLGNHENPPDDKWERIEAGSVVAYRKVPQ